MYRRIVEANDSCLFTSLGLAFNNSFDNSQFLRNLVATRILNDQQFFNEAVLGKSPAEYASWIKNTHSWGGAIEMMILSDYLKSEIVAVDIMNVRFEVFG
jgi:ubiquitin thioesterase OTU1